MNNRKFHLTTEFSYVFLDIQKKKEAISASFGMQLFSLFAPGI